MTTEVNNVVDLRTQLCDLFYSVKVGDIDPKAARNLVGTAREIINSCRVELEYAHLTRTKPTIKFLETASE